MAVSADLFIMHDRGYLLIWPPGRRMEIGKKYNAKALFDGIIIISFSISLHVTGQKKKVPGLLNLERYAVNWVGGFGILEDRLWPTDEKNLLKIFGNSVGSFDSLLLLGQFKAYEIDGFGSEAAGRPSYI